MENNDKNTERYKKISYNKNVNNTSDYLNVSNFLVMGVAAGSFSLYWIALNTTIWQSSANAVTSYDIAMSHNNDCYQVLDPDALVIAHVTTIVVCYVNMSYQ